MLRQVGGEGGWAALARGDDYEKELVSSGWVMGQGVGFWVRISGCMFRFWGAVCRVWGSSVLGEGRWV